MDQAKDNDGHQGRDSAARERSEEPRDVAAKHPTKEEEQKKKERDEAIDEASEGSFPSSDPPSW